MHAAFKGEAARLRAELPNFQNGKTTVGSRQFHNEWLSDL